MVILPIQKNEDDDTPQEWSLLELNGEILPPKVPNEDDDMELGKVKFDDDGTPIMTIGTHEIKGKVQDLKQPFVVMKALKRALGDDKEVQIDEKRINLGGDGHMGYMIAGVVKNKLLFDRYPKSIMK